MKFGISFSVIVNVLTFRFQYWFIKNTMGLKPGFAIFALSRHLIFIGFFPLLAPIQSFHVNQVECFLVLSDKKCTSIHCFHATSSPFYGKERLIWDSLWAISGEKRLSQQVLNVVWNNEQGMLEIVGICSFLPLWSGCWRQLQPLA